MTITTYSRHAGKETFGAYFYLDALANQEIEALRHDLKELEKEEQ